MTESTPPVQPEPPAPIDPATLQDGPPESFASPSLDTTPPLEIPRQPPAGQPYPGQGYPGQGYPGQQYVGPQNPVQQYPVQQYPGPQYPGQPYPGPQYPGQAYPGPAYPDQLAPAQPYSGEPEAPAPTPAKKRRGALLVTLVLVVVVLLCGGVGTTAYVVTEHHAGTGQDSPVLAGSAFLTAIYLHQDATEAETYVCEQADDEHAIAEKVDQVKTLSTKYVDPTFSWAAWRVTKQSATEATETTTLTLATADERVASQTITIVTVKNHGWWVCDVKTTST